MPVGSGTLLVRYSFVAIAILGADVPTLTLPACPDNLALPPVADFSFQPANPDEGRVVLFSDQSTDPDSDIRYEDRVVPGPE